MSTHNGLIDDDEQKCRLKQLKTIHERDDDDDDDVKNFDRR